MKVLFSVLLLVTYQLVFSQIPKQSDLVGVYNFNSNVNDESGKNYNGILGGSPSLTTDRFGNSNSAYLLDGVDDFIYFGNESLSDFTTNSNGYINESFSISVWAKSTNSNNSSFLALGESLGLYTGMIIRMGSTIAFNSSNDAFNTSSSGKHNDGLWHNYVFIWDYSVQKRYLYIDGVLAGTGNYTRTNVFSIKNYGLSFGKERYGDTSNMNYNGSVDDIKFWKTALNSSEVASLYSYDNSPSPPPGFVGVAYEGFNYTYQATLVGESGGYGFSGEWQNTTGNVPNMTHYVLDPSVAEGGGFNPSLIAPMTYTGLYTSGLYVGDTNSATNIKKTDFRNIASTLNNGIYYVQFLVQFDGNPSADGDNYFILKEDDSEKLVISRKKNSANNIKIHMGKTINSSSSSDLVDSGKSLIVKTAQLIIIQIDNSTNSTKLWVDPNYTTFDYSNPPSEDASLNYSFNFNRIQLVSDNDSFSYNGTLFDEISIYNRSNSAPSNISLTSTSVNENVAIGTTIGTLSTTDSDSGDTHTYTLVSGTGDTDNTSFSISGANLLTNTALDYETKNSYSILVQTSDNTATYTKTFTITVNDVDEDSDGDGITNNLDNCPSTANADQLDTDGDGEGDVIDTDDDGDGVADSEDAFPLDASESADTDGDGVGDSVDPDLDNDGILDTVDNCLYTPNADQLDTDADGIGNVCDPDDDGDGFSDADEITCGTDPLLASSKPLDTDNDGIANCIDTDDDGDGYLDTDEATCGSDPLDATSKPLDTDSDGIANCIDTDDDNDSYLDENDAFPLDASEWLDTDADGIGNNADSDDDGDGQLDTDEIACGSDPLLASSMSLDTDVDNLPDCIDTDDDNDGLIDTEDAFPLDQTEWTDTDGDGIGNNADEDDDNDGFTDLDELACDSNPLDRFNKPSDQDNDLIPDCVDGDKDGDGYLNDNDAFPDDADEWIDTDGDGLGDNFEVDDDNDGYLDTNDAFPLDPNEWADADNDGIGDNADSDDNNDGFEDDKLFSSGVLTPGSGGLEDTWKIINIEQYPTNRVSVYDKNGQEVFSATNYKNNWRGTFKNSANPLPVGSYYYVVDLNNGQDQIKGWLYITY